MGLMRGMQLVCISKGVLVEKYNLALNMLDNTSMTSLLRHCYFNFSSGNFKSNPIN